MAWGGLTRSRDSSHIGLVRYSFNPGDEGDAGNHQSREPAIIRDEKIGVGGRRAGELNSVRWPDPHTASNFRVPRGGFPFKRNQLDGSVGKKVAIALLEDRIACLLGLGKGLAESEVAGEQFEIGRAHV